MYFLSTFQTEREVLKKKLTKVVASLEHLRRECGAKIVNSSLYLAASWKDECMKNKLGEGTFI